MKLNIPRFLKASGIWTGPSGDWSRCRCPLHPDMDSGGSMSVSMSGPCGDAVFSCADPRCRFRGDAVLLVAMWRGVGMTAAAEMFTGSGEFAGCLDEPMSRAEAAECAAGARRDVEAYMAVCRREYLRHPEQAAVVAGPSQSSPRGLIGDVGVMVDAGVPRFLQPAMSGFRGMARVVYPFTMDGDVTHAVVSIPASRDPGRTSDLRFTSPDGVFGESRAEAMRSSGSTRLFVCESPELAARVRSIWAMSHGSDSAPVVAGSFPLPASFSHARHVVLFGDESCPPSLGFALSAVACESAVRGVPRHSQPRIRVLTGRRAPFDSRTVDRMLMGQTSSEDAVPWAASAMVRAVDAGTAQAVSDALSANPLRPALAEALSRAAMACGGSGAAASAVSDMLRGCSGPSDPSDMRLANGRRVRALPDSVVAVSPTGIVETLSNVGIEVDGKILRPDGSEVVSARVSARPDLPKARVLLGPSDVSGSKSLRRAVSAAFSSAGFSPYVAFYDLPGYSWPDIVCRMADMKPVSREVCELGMDGMSDVRFPSVAVRSDGSVDSDCMPPTVPDHVSRMYGGLYMPDEGAWEFKATKRLLGSCGNLYCAAYACGLAHVLHQAVFAKNDVNAAKAHARRHLLYVETEPGIWDGVFKALSDTFSGSDAVQSVPYCRAAEYLSRYSGLGLLPVVARAQAAGQRLAPALLKSGSALVGLVDSATASSACGKMQATYVVPCDESERAGAHDAIDIDGIRSEFLPLVSLLVRGHVDGRFATASIPCLEVLGRLSAELGAETGGLPAEIALPFFQGTGMSGADSFMELLHALSMPGSRPRINVVPGRPDPDFSFTRSGRHVFVGDDEVTIGRIVVDIVNRSPDTDPKFDAGQLVSEMSRRGMLADTAPGMAGDRVITMKRAAWDEFVARPPVEIGPVSAV